MRFFVFCLEGKTEQRVPARSLCRIVNVEFVNNNFVALRDGPRDLLRDFYYVHRYVLSYDCFTDAINTYIYIYIYIYIHIYPRVKIDTYVTTRIIDVIATYAHMHIGRVNKREYVCNGNE